MPNFRLSSWRSSSTTTWLRIGSLCKHLDWQVDTHLLNRMKKVNEEELKRLDDELEDAEKNLGESDIRDARVAWAEHLCRVGNKEGALTTFWKTCDKTVAFGHLLDIVFYCVGLFFMDNDLITLNTEKACSLIEVEGDWNHRNCLKVYQGLHYVAIQDFKQAVEVFLDNVYVFLLLADGLQDLCHIHSVCQYDCTGLVRPQRKG